MPDDSLNKPPEEKPAEYSYDELHKEEVKDIASNTEVPEEKSPEKPVEEKKSEVPEKPEEVIDTSKLAEEVADKVVEKTKPPEEKPIEKTEEEKYKEWANDFKTKEGKDPTWTDVATHLKEDAIKAIDDREAEKVRVAEETKKVAEENDKKLTDNFNKIVDEDLDDLYKSNKLTPIKDKANPSDQGILERKALFNTMLEVNTERAKEGKRPIYSIKEIYYEHYTKPNAQPAGENAPISVGKGAPSSGEEEQELDYNKDVKNTTWGNLRAVFGKK
jgi:hypothetical protein